MSRRVLILAHTGREESLKAAWEACARLHDSGIVPVMLKSELGDMVRFFGRLAQPVERHCNVLARLAAALGIHDERQTVTPAPQGRDLLWRFGGVER